MKFVTVVDNRAQIKPVTDIRAPTASTRTNRRLPWTRRRERILYDARNNAKTAVHFA